MNDGMTMKERMALLKGIKDSPVESKLEDKEPEIKKSNDKNATEPKAQPTSEKTEKKKGKIARNAPPIPEDIARAYTEQEYDLVDRIRDFEVSPENRRMTYIIDKRNFDILNTLKNETGAPVINLINFFLDEAIKANSKEIDKIIRKQYQNLKL